ncbi:MAG: histidine phosphatase family protein [Ruminiclostridium sp.]|nr:histidine phosphatase family protein [Ruminiclostridium sp.]
MKLLVIRHGESEADILNVHEGRADFELTERGHRQAEAMSEYVSKNYQVAKIYHSTLKRAAQTAEHLALKTKAQLIPDEHLMEFNNGLLAGLTHSEADEKYPKMDIPVHLSVYEQESVLEFRYRAEYMLSKLLSENDEDAVIAVVTHGGMINQLYRTFLKLPVETDYAFFTGDTGIHEWIVVGNCRYLAKANYVPHNI